MHNGLLKGFVKSVNIFPCDLFKFNSFGGANDDAAQDGNARASWR